MDQDFLKSLPQLMDISCVKADNSMEEIEQMIQAAWKYRCACIFTLPAFAGLTVKELAGSGVKTGGAVGFPSGGDTSRAKLYQAGELLQLGCKELDMVINQTALKAHMDSYIMDETSSIVKEAGKIPVKVILEISNLNEEEISRGCNLIIQAGAEYVKSGTGWAGVPTTVRDIQKISEIVKGHVKIKAAGGIRNLENMYEMYQWGCSRFGISLKSALEILKTYKQTKLYQ